MRYIENVKLRRIWLCFWFFPVVVVAITELIVWPFLRDIWQAFDRLPRSAQYFWTAFWYEMSFAWNEKK